MAERAKVKKPPKAGKAPSAARKPAAAPAAKRQRPVAAPEKPADRVAALESECAELRRQLAAAQQQITKLKRSQDLVVNRIDWVIDSLHNLIEDQG